MSSLTKNPHELELMRISGEINAKALKKALEGAKPGVSLKEIDLIAESEILRLGGKPAFKTVPGYFWTSCLNINDEVVHGIPRDIKLNSGDVFSIDLGTIYKGWYSDAAWTVVVGQNKDEEKARFLNTGEQALWDAVKFAKVGCRIGDISSTIQREVEMQGYSIIKSLTGHGVGRSYHEKPIVPGYGKAGEGLDLKEGMTLAVEVIYAGGGGDIYEKSDGWTIASVDGSLTGLFEATVIVGKTGSEIITDWTKV